MKFVQFMAAFYLSASLLASPQNSSETTKESTGPASASSAARKEVTPKSNGPIDVLTDTRGFNLHPYLTEKVLPNIKKNWYALIPEVARPPIMKRGTVTLQFKLSRDGKVTDIRLKESSGDVSLDRAAFAGVANSSPLPALPSDYQCQDLALRFHFYYNPSRDDDVHNPDDSLRSVIPCVRTKIKSGDDVALLVSPEAAKVVLGQVQQFTAALTGSNSAGVKWTLHGAGCEGSACGTISADGLYTAPSKLPDPATITITAQSDVASDAASSATITLLNNQQ